MAKNSLSAGLQVAVEQHLLIRDVTLGIRWGAGVGGLDPAVDRILRAGHRAYVVPIGRAARMRGVRRDAEVGLLGPGLDLVEDGVGQLFQLSGLGLGVGVLRLQIGDDFGVVLVAKPFVRIFEDVIVVDAAMRSPISERGGQIGGGFDGHLGKPSVLRRGSGTHVRRPSGASRRSPRSRYDPVSLHCSPQGLEVAPLPQWLSRRPCDASTQTTHISTAFPAQDTGHGLNVPNR